MENVIGKFHHVGLAVHDFESVLDFYSMMGYHKELEIYDPEQNVNVCVLEGDNNQPIIELLAPYNEQSPICAILKKNGSTPYHVCYEVEDINTSIQTLRKRKFMVMSTPKLSNAFGNRLVAFLWNKQVGLIELIEQSK